MKKQKLGTAVIWMVCLLGMAALVWSRPPLGRGSNNEHPPLALANPHAANPGQADAASISSQSSPKNETAEAAAPTTEQTTRVWVREYSPYKLTMEFTGNRLNISVRGVLDGEGHFECRLSADYQVTRDSIAYGVITSAELLLKNEDAATRLEADELAQTFYDQPFAFRFRQDANLLTIKSFKFGRLPAELEEIEALAKLVVGCYHPQSEDDEAKHEIGER